MERSPVSLSRRQSVLGAGVVSVGLAAGCGQLPWQAQAPVRTPRLGLLVAGPRSPLEEEFRDELRKLGYVDGQSIVIEARYAQDNQQQAAALAAELLQLPVDAVATLGSRATFAASEVTDTVPIVQVWGAGELVGSKRVASLARPGGNVTGMTEIAGELIGKLLELLKMAAPAVSQVVVLTPFPRHHPAHQLVEAGSQHAAMLLGITVQLLPVDTPDDLDPALEEIARGTSNGLVVVGGFIVNRRRQQIVDLALARRMPTIANRRDFAVSGGLLAYKGSPAGNTGRAAALVDKVLKGANPGDLPVERPMRFDFVANLKTAQAIGITFPQEILLQVTEVIDQ
jgi:putative ABC transport system substrate-binding protein